MFLQLSAGTAEKSSRAPPPQQDRLQILQSETEALRSSIYKLTSERDQAQMDVAALRDALTSQQQRHATNVGTQMGGACGRGCIDGG